MSKSAIMISGLVALALTVILSVTLTPGPVDLTACRATAESVDSLFAPRQTVECQAALEIDDIRTSSTR